jgi:hypothetical protein
MEIENKDEVVGYVVHTFDAEGDVRITAQVGVEEFTAFVSLINQLNGTNFTNEEAWDKWQIRELFKQVKWNLTESMFAIEAIC